MDTLYHMRQACMTLWTSAGYNRVSPYLANVKPLMITTLLALTLILIIVAIFQIRKYRDKKVNKWNYIIPILILAMIALCTIIAIPVAYNKAATVANTLVQETIESGREQYLQERSDAALKYIQINQEETKLAIIFLILSAISSVIISAIIQRTRYSKLYPKKAITPILLSQCMIYNMIAVFFTHGVYYTDMDILTYIPNILAAIITILPTVPLCYATFKNHPAKIIPIVTYPTINIAIFMMLYNAIYTPHLY